MSALRAVLDRLNDIEASISRVQMEANAESAFAYRMTLQSLENRREELREELIEITRHDFVQICDYRIIPKNQESYAVSAVTTALHDFQDLVTYVFDAITSKPKQRARIDPDIYEKTRFNFGFAYAGSLGVVLTIPNERLLAIDSDLDRAVSIVFEVMKANSAERIKEIATLYGIPTIRKLYTWSKIHADYSMSSEIKWIREKETRVRVMAQPQELIEVCRLIEGKGETSRESISMTGILVAYSVPGRTFTMEFPEGEPIRGSFAKEYDVDATAHPTIRNRYTVDLLKETVSPYASDKDEVSWTLVGLSKPK